MKINGQSLGILAAVALDLIDRLMNLVHEADAAVEGLSQEERDVYRARRAQALEEAKATDAENS